MNTLYIRNNDPFCWTVIKYMKIHQIPFEKKVLDFKKKENLFEDFRKISSRGEVPVLLQEGKTSVCGTMPIIFFLDKNVTKHDDEKIGTDYSRIDEMNQHLKRSFCDFEKLFHSDRKYDESCFQKFDLFLEDLSKFDEHLSGRSYFGGDTETLADLFCGPFFLYVSSKYNIDLDLFRLKNMKRYIELLQSKNDWVDVCSLEEKEKIDENDMKSFEKLYLQKGFGKLLLPTDVIPKKYIIDFDPNLNEDQFNFQGTCEIEFNIIHPTQVITLNSKELSYRSCELVFFKEKEKERTEEEEESHHKAYHIDLNNSLQQVKFYFDQTVLEKMKNHSYCSLKIDYEGILNDQMEGFYRSQYKGKDGKTKFMATTQFEAVGARKAFPCFDEPNHKSIFYCSLIIDTDKYYGLSNMPVEKEQQTSNSKKTKIQFCPSVQMSTYLVAFAVLPKEDYGYIEAFVHRKEGKEEDLRVRVWTTRLDEGQFALDTAVKVIPLYEEYFEMLFPLPKVDLLACQEFAAGAMENWGLITFRETAILLSKLSGAARKQRVAIVVIHEIAHSWFGNFVTMKWWDELWLNEGFAVWCEYFFTNKLYPEMNINTFYITEDFVRALSMDALKSSHPIQVHVSKGEDVDEIFDVISYEKGCAIVRMIVEYVGIETFRKGVVQYLKEFKFGNATSNDLWRHISNVSGKDLKFIMDSWISQTGYPFVDVKIKERKEDGTITLLLKQKRFLSSGIDDYDSSLWKIPLSYRTSENPQQIQKVLMEDREMELMIQTTTTKEEKDFWILMNPSLTGFYRTLYDPSLIQSLTNVLSSFEEVDRFAIQMDVAQFSKAGLISIPVALDLLKSYKGETSFCVMDGIASSLGNYYALIKSEENEEIRKKFYAFGTDVFKDLYDLYACLTVMEEEKPKGHIEVMMQRLVTSSLLSYQYPSLIEQAKTLFYSSPEKIHPDLLTSVLIVVVKEDGEKGFNAVKEYFLNTERNEEQVKCLSALGATPDPSILQRVLEFGLTDAVKSQDRIYLFASVAFRSIPHGPSLLWDFFRKNANLFREKFKGMMIPAIIKVCCKGFESKERIQEIKEFFQKEHFAGVGRSIEQSIDVIQNKILWIEKGKKPLIQWLNQNKY